jgi:hypothetical protein
MQIGRTWTDNAEQCEKRFTLWAVPAFERPHFTRQIANGRCSRSAEDAQITLVSACGPKVAGPLRLCRDGRDHRWRRGRQYGCRLTSGTHERDRTASTTPRRLGGSPLPQFCWRQESSRVGGQDSTNRSFSLLLQPLPPRSASSARRHWLSSDDHIERVWLDRRERQSVVRLP